MCYICVIGFLEYPYFSASRPQEHLLLKYVLRLTIVIKPREMVIYLPCGKCYRQAHITLSGTTTTDAANLI
mgnify:CR=1 FL=1